MADKQKKDNSESPNEYDPAGREASPSNNDPLAAANNADDLLAQAEAALEVPAEPSKQPEATDSTGALDSTAAWETKDLPTAKTGSIPLSHQEHDVAFTETDQPGKIEDVLKDADLQLTEIEKELGDMDNSSEDSSPAGDPKTSLSAEPENETDKISEVDQTLAKLDKEIEQLTSEIAQVDDSTDQDASTAEDESQANDAAVVDDTSPVTAEKLDPPEEPDAVIAECDEAPCEAATDEEEDDAADSALDDIESPETEVAETGPEEVTEEDQPSCEVVDPVETESSTENQSDTHLEEIIDELPDIPDNNEHENIEDAGSSQDALDDIDQEQNEQEQSADVMVNLSSSDQVDEDEQVILEELDQAIDPDSQDSLDDKVSQPKPQENPYSHFPLPQRMVAQSLNTVNKPFEFVGQTSRDIIGIIAIITVIMSMIGAAVALWLR